MIFSLSAGVRIMMAPLTPVGPSATLLFALLPDVCGADRGLEPLEGIATVCHDNDDDDDDDLMVMPLTHTWTQAASHDCNNWQCLAAGVGIGR